MSSTLFFKKKEVQLCTCAARKEAIFQDTYKEIIFNKSLDHIDVLILLEHKETTNRLNIFNHLCKLYFKDISFAIVYALGCTPKNFTSQNIISTYSKCKEVHINKIIIDLQPKVIITTGRALYTITETKELRPEHFFTSVNNSIKSYNIDDSYIYSSQYKCKVFPIPALYQWINTEVKDVYEYKFAMEQFKRAKIVLIELPKRILKLNLQFIENPDILITQFINDVTIEAISIDTESSGLNYFEDSLYSIQFAVDQFTGYFCYWKDVNKDLLIELFNRKDITFIMHHAQHDLKFLIQNNIHNAKCDFDTLLASHSLNENSPNGLKSLTWIYTYYGGYDFKIKQYLKQYKIVDFTQLPSDMLLEYACYDAVITYILYQYFKQRFELEDNFVKNNFYQFVMPAVEMITNVEMTGVKIDLKYLYEYVQNLKKQANQIEKEIYEIAGKKFNLKSSKEVSILFRSIPNFSPLEDKKGNPLLTKNGDLILDKETLEKYAVEKNIIFAKRISEYNHYVKEISGLGFNLENIEKQNQNSLFEVYTKDEESEEDDNGKGFLASIHNNRLYGGYKLHGTDTGRMSGGGGLNSTINWQNQPTSKKFRKLFLPELGYVIGRADYDAMEICIISQLSGTGPLEQVILSGKDPHCYLAVNLAKLQGVKSTYEEIFEKSKVEEKIDSWFVDLRTKAKILGFQCVYGATKYGLANTFNISLEEAEQFLIIYRNTFPEVAEYIDNSRNHAQQFGWVKTLLGRKRRLPELTYIGQDSFYNYESSFNINNLLNAAINAPDQGTSGQTTLIAMTNIYKEFKKEKMKSKILINVHDEIVFELYVLELQKAKIIIKTYMEKPYYKNNNDCKVVLSIGLEYGEIWKYGYSYEYWENHPKEYKQMVDSINQRNKVKENIIEKKI